MRNSRRWKEFITWWVNLEVNCYEDVQELSEQIDNKIEEIQRRKV